MEDYSLPKRKHPRLKNYDYSSNGSYYITLCTLDKKCILGFVPKRKNIDEAPQTVLSDIGGIVKKYIESISSAYPNVSLDNYVIMPNHIHLLLSLNNDSSVDIPQIIKAFKRLSAKEIGYQIWQESFFDEVIKNDTHLQNVWNYIEYNTCKWEDDDYFML